MQNSPENSTHDVIQIIKQLQTLAKAGAKPSDMLRYLALDLNIEQQLEWMRLFTQAFDLNLGEVTAISGWWHDNSAELNDNDINAYISPLINQYLQTETIAQKPTH